MTTEEILIASAIFRGVDDHLPTKSKHPPARLYPSELVTSGLLVALKGGPVRAFDRGVRRDDAALFGGLPARTRVRRRVRVHPDWRDALLAAPSFFAVIDAAPRERLFPGRAGRSRKQVGQNGRDTGRGRVGIKRCWPLDNQGHVVSWEWAPMNTPASAFHRLMRPLEGQRMVLAERGLRSHEGEGRPPASAVPKAPGWNERLRVEPRFSRMSVSCDLKRLRPRTDQYISARLACVAALFTVLLTLFHRLHPDAARGQMSIAELSL